MTIATAQQLKEGITVLDVSSVEDGRIHFMDAHIEIHLPDYVRHAIYNGIPLPMLLQIEVNEKKDWWLDQTLVIIEQRYVLHYYPLFDSFRLNNLTNGSSQNLSSFDNAFQKIGVISRFPILDNEHFPNSEDLYARIRLKIDIAALPKPLRNESLLGGSWDIASEWKEWALQ